MNERREEVSRDEDWRRRSECRLASHNNNDRQRDGHHRVDAGHSSAFYPSPPARSHIQPFFPSPPFCAKKSRSHLASLQLSPRVLIAVSHPARIVSQAQADSGARPATQPAGFRQGVLSAVKIEACVVCHAGGRDGAAYHPAGVILHPPCPASAVRASLGCCSRCRRQGCLELNPCRSAGQAFFKIAGRRSSLFRRPNWAWLGLSRA